MVEHPSDDALFDFARGEPSAETGPAFERHVSTCDACAARLAREARLELALADVAALRSQPQAQVGSIARARRRRRVGVAIAAALAVAAALVIVLRKPRWAAASSPIPDVVCVDGPEQEACIRRAHRHGLFVAYPSRAGAPRFDSSPGGKTP